MERPFGFYPVAILRPVSKDRIALEFPNPEVTTPDLDTNMPRDMLYRVRALDFDLASQVQQLLLSSYDAADAPPEPPYMFYVAAGQSKTQTTFFYGDNGGLIQFTTNTAFRDITVFAARDTAEEAEALCRSMQRVAKEKDPDEADAVAEDLLRSDTNLHRNSQKSSSATGAQS